MRNLHYKVNKHTKREAYKKYRNFLISLTATDTALAAHAKPFRATSQAGVFLWLCFVHHNLIMAVFIMSEKQYNYFIAEIISSCNRNYSYLVVVGQ